MRAHSQFSLRSQLVWLGAVSLGGLLAVGGLSTVSVWRLSDQLEKLSATEFQAQSRIVTLRSQVEALSRSEKSSLLNIDRVDAARSDQAAWVSAAAKAKEQLKDLPGGGEAGRIQAVEQALAHYEQLAAPVLQAAINGQIVTSNEAFEKLQPALSAMGALDGALAQLSQEVIQRAQARERAVRAEASMTLSLLLLVVMAALGGSLPVLWRVTRNVRDTLSQAQDASRRVAAGDLRQDVVVQGPTESVALLEAIQGMQDHLRAVLGRVSTTSRAVQDAGDELLTGAQDLAQRTDRAASQLVGTARRLTEVSQSVGEVAAMSSHMSQLSEQAQGAARHGGQVVGQVVTRMQAIVTQSKDIEQIVGVIDGLAFQTNLLALNAAVEAARAGEQGRGFAVVATEVRQLAQRSADSARQIRALIQRSAVEVETGFSQVAATQDAMQQIIGSVTQLASQAKALSGLAAEQSGQVGEVERSVQDMERVTQANAAMVQASARAAQGLQGQAAGLTQALTAFRW